MVKRLGTIAGIVLAVSGMARGTALCTDQSAGGVGGNKLSNYISTGVCSIGDYLFTFNGSSYSYDGAITAANVVVQFTTPTSNQVQVSFSAGWVAIVNQTFHLDIQYTVSAAGGLSAIGNTFNGSTNGAGTLAEDAVCGDGTHPCTPNVDFTNSYPGTVAVVPPTTSTVSIFNTATLKGNGTQSSDLAHLSYVQDNFFEMQVPEPATALLLGGALVVFGLRRKVNRAV